MLRITPSASADGAKKYFGEGLSRSDYYIDGQEVPGRWGGKAAERLGLSGQVDRDSYFALCDNRDPRTGDKLTPRDKDNRRVGFDFTFSAPKSVSVLYELTGDERIVQAFRESVRETMEEGESEMKTRVRVKGANEDRETGNMVWAEFVHFTSRPVNGIPSPHLHAHMYAFNLTHDGQESRWKAGQFGDLKRDAPYWEKAFDARFAQRLNEIGYATVKDPKYSFHIAGFTPEMVDKFSDRRNQIEAIAKEKGITSAKGKHAITKWSREHKTLDQGKTELRRLWADRLDSEEAQKIRAIKAGKAGPSPSVSADAAIAYAIDHSFGSRHSTRPEKRVLADALHFGVGSVTPEAIHAAAARREDLLVVPKDGQRIATTKAVLQSEIDMLRLAREGRGQGRAFDVRDEWLSHLDAEGKEAATRTLLSRDFVFGIEGRAGTGKTTLLKTLNDVFKREDVKVFAFAQSASASRGTLREAGFENATTLAALYRSEALQKALKGSVVLVDESSLSSTRDIGKVLAIAKREGAARVIPVGDTRQHASVDAGDGFRLLRTEAGVQFAELRTVRRQTRRDYRKAVEAISQGTREGVQRGFDQLDRMGAIVEAKGPERHALLVHDYLATVARGKSALIVAPTHAEGDALTQELRDRLRAKGTLTEQERRFEARKATHWTDAQKRDAANYHPEAGMVVECHEAVSGERLRSGGKRATIGGFAKGESALVVGQEEGRVVLLRQDGSKAYLPDRHVERFQVFTTHTLGISKGDRIRINKNDRNLNVSNGDVLSVTGFTKGGDLKLSNGKVMPKTFGHLSLGYVDTSYSSQGKTVDRVFIAAGESSLPAVNAQQWYVSVSRGREAVKVYVDDKQEVREAIARSGERLAAVELMRGESGNAARRGRLQEMLVRNRALRYFREQREAIAERWRGRTVGRGRSHA